MMKDGNKESAKELLATFRTLFALNASALFLVVNLHTQDLLTHASVGWFWLGIVLAGLSLLTMIYLFLLAIPKLFREEDRIVYQSDIQFASAMSIFCFFVGYAIIASVASLKTI